MRTRKLGKQGPEVPVICLGAWPLGGGMGAITDRQVADVVHAALDAGINFIDTAEGYRTSEASLGKALAGRRHRAILATKLTGEHSWEHMQRAVENSLRALQTDYIDLYQLHSPDSRHPIEQTIDHLVKLKEAGKIRYIGVSNFSEGEHARALKVAHVDSSQPRYNLLWREAEANVLPFCLKNGIGVIVHSPLAKGLLTGKYRPEHVFLADDERSRFATFQGEAFECTLAVADRLKGWAEARGRTLAQLAIAWTLAHPAVTSSIVGAKTPEQVRQNAEAADWQLSADDLREIDSLIGGYRLDTAQ